MNMNLHDIKSDAILNWNRESNSLFYKMKQRYVQTVDDDDDNDDMSSADDDHGSLFTSPNIPSVNHSSLSEFSEMMTVSLRCRDSLLLFPAVTFLCDSCKCVVRLNPL